MTDDIEHLSAQMKATLADFDQGLQRFAHQALRLAFDLSDARAQLKKIDETAQHIQRLAEAKRHE